MEPGKDPEWVPGWVPGKVQTRLVFILCCHVIRQWKNGGKNNLGDSLAFVGYLCGQYVQIIGVKAPGNYLDQFGSNRISVLLCERPKPPNFMIPGFLDPGEPLSMDLNIPNYFNKSKKNMETFSNILFL